MPSARVMVSGNSSAQSLAIVPADLSLSKPLPRHEGDLVATCENALSTSEGKEGLQASTGIGVQLVKTP